MMLFLWIVVFIVSLVVLIKGADWLIESAEKIGLVLGLSPFLVGVLIVGIGTSCPELISSFLAAFRGLTDVPVANAVGSNIANILLVVGVSAIVSKKLIVTKSLINSDLPLLIIGTILLLGSTLDGKVTTREAIVMLVSYLIYLLYTILCKGENKEKIEEITSRRRRRENLMISKQETLGRSKITIKDIIYLLFGIICLVIGAEYLVQALINLSGLLNVPTGVIAITAMAVGTSLPELVVSIKAAAEKKSDIALGNIFGSNVFNTLMVVGLPALFKTLTIDSQTLTIGLPTMALATLLFIISGILKKIHIWEGIFYLVFYFLFVVKLLGIV